MRDKSLIRVTGNPDYWLIAILLVLLVLGTILVYTASSGHLYVSRGPAYVLIQHLLRVAVGAVALLVASRLDYHIWQRWPIPLLIASAAVLMLLALQLATRVEGAKVIRWALEGPLGQSVQPSELAKLAAVIYMAAWLSSKGEKVRMFSYGFIPFVILLSFMTGLILAQPDFSTALIIGCSAVAMFFIAGADMKQLLLLFALAGIIAPLIVREYMIERALAWLRSLLDPTQVNLTGMDYQPFYTTTALAAGGITGVGLGGSQHKAYLSSMAHTDMIMAIAGEEMGLVGSLLILGLFAALAYRGIKIALEAPDSFGSLLAVGITTWLTLQALVHAAVVSQLMPVTGMPLPFISFGGSALLMEMAGIGLLLNISKHGIQESRRENAYFAVGGRHRRPRLSRAHRR